jgi:hypothetical protein
LGYYLRAYADHLKALGQSEANTKSIFSDFEHVLLKFYLGERSAFKRVTTQTRANLITTATQAFQAIREETNRRFNRERRAKNLSNSFESLVRIIVSYFI